MIDEMRVHPLPMQRVPKTVAPKRPKRAAPSGDTPVTDRWQHWTAVSRNGTRVPSQLNMRNEYRYRLGGICS